MLPVSDHSTSESPAESYAAENWRSALELVALSNASATRSPVLVVMLSCVPNRCVLFGEKSPNAPKAQWSPGWYSPPAERVVTIPPRSPKAAPAGAGVDCSRVMSTPARIDQSSPASNVALSESEMLPERGLFAVAATLFALTSSETFAARDGAEASTSAASNFNRTRMCKGPRDRSNRQPVL